MPVFHYTGRTQVSPFMDIDAYVARLRQQFPSISDRGVNQTVKRSLDLIRPRQKTLVVAFWGRDILTENLAGLWFWPLLKPYQKGRLSAHPLDGGMTDDGDPQRKKALLASGDFAAVNRSVLVCARDGRQVSATAVFCAHTEWKQEMTDVDAAILLSYPQVRHLLVREDAFTGYHPVTSYNHIPVRERHAASSARDLDYLIRQHRRTHAHPSVDVPDERT